jgi:hypothetical protein
MILECRTAEWCECTGVSKVKTHYLQSSSVSILQRNIEQWNAEVTAYSRLELTYERDRLPALSGLARRLNAAKLERYLAGIWEGELPGGLFWACEDKHAHRASEYVAPSWSWASIVGEVNACGHSKLSNARGDFALTWMCKDHVVDAGCTPRNAGNPLGSVLTGFIKLRAPVIVASSSCGALQYKGDVQMPKLLIDIATDNEKYLWQSEDRDLVLLGFKGILEEESKPAYRVLLLEKSDQEGNTYSRVGQIKWNYEHATGWLARWFDTAELTDITIV